MAQQGNSERACDRCRERRVKCDKTQPTCLRCEKLGKPCPGYDKKRKFVDEGESLRKKYQTSTRSAEAHGTPGRSIERPTTADGSASRADLVSPSKSTFASPHTVDARAGHDRTPSFPAQAFPTTSDSHAAHSQPPLAFTNPNPVLFPEASYRPPALEDDTAMSDLWNDSTLNPEWFNLEPDVYYTTGLNNCGFIPDLPNIIDEVDRDVLPTTETNTATPMSGLAALPEDNLWAPQSQLNTSAIITDEREHEMAYLIRHFTEAIGPWMDLFDNDKHFGNLVPLKALRDALLRNAIAAVAAKQLGRVKGTKPYVGIQSQKPATMEVIDDVPEVDWFYKAANYYDKAIAFSRLYLQAISGSFGTPGTPNTQAAISRANSDDLLVAVSIFSLYESLDNMELDWLQHLAGLKSLLNTVSADEQARSEASCAITVGRRASFWNFARADYQAAYINHQYTFLDTEDLILWRSCGLQLQDDGSLYNDPGKIKNDPSSSRDFAELVSHTLLWIILRVMNYIANDQEKAPTMQIARWLQLTGQLDEWHANLPQTFQPCAQIPYHLPGGPPRGTSSPSELTEVFFSINLCAAALQLYHFVRILLLLNKPIQQNETDASGSRMLKAYREVSREATKHAHQIIGIALGRPHPAVRVEMLLPLFIAGTCLEADEKRKVVLELLRAIEKDTGCSTEGRCVELMREWGWTKESGDVPILSTMPAL